MPAQDIRLPLLCQVIHLGTLPQQPEGSRYIVAWGGGIREPEGGLGYVFDMSGKRFGHPVAWLRDGGFVYAVDGLIDEIPDAEPAITLARWRNRADSGRITARAGADEVRQVAEYRMHGSAGYSVEEPACDLGGTYTAARMPFRELLALSFLAFYHLPRLAGKADTLGRTMSDVLEVFSELPPADAVDTLIAEVASGARTSGFERYAALVLSDADPAAFRALTARHEVALRRLGATGLFWMAADLNTLGDEEFDTLVGMEAALNRLVLIALRARKNSSDALGATTFAFCADEDWRTLRSITDQTASLLREAVRTENPLRTLYGTEAVRGGEWDVRTRFAGILERLVLPYRLTYRFAVHAETGEITVAVKLPTARSMPQWMRAPADVQTTHGGEPSVPGGARAGGTAVSTDAPESPTTAGPDTVLQELAAEAGLVSCSDRADAAATAYALRLVAALAAAGFGSGPGVARVRVRLCADRAFLQPLIAADVDRTSYLMSIYDAIRKGIFSEPRYAMDIDALFKLLQPARLAYRLNARGGLEPLSPAGEGQSFEANDAADRHEYEADELNNGVGGLNNEADGLNAGDNQDEAAGSGVGAHRDEFAEAHDSTPRTDGDKPVENRASAPSAEDVAPNAEEPVPNPVNVAPNPGGPALNPEAPKQNPEVPTPNPEDLAPFDPDHARTLPLWRDNRPLTPELASLLHADAVCDLDVYHLGEDPYKERLAETIKLAEGNPREAAQRLADLLDVMNVVDEVNGDEPESSQTPASDAMPTSSAGDSAAAAPNPQAPAAPRRLYCSSGMARLAMSLDDPNPQTRYRYVNDTRYDALVSLARLCIDNDDAVHGLEYAEQAIALGPTSPRAYIVAATGRAELCEFDRAADLLKKALRYDMEPLSYTYTYYRLAFVLWRNGDLRTGLACYERALVNPRLRGLVEQEMAELMAQAHLERQLEPEEVEAALSAADIVSAPSDEMLALVARAMITAADSGFINLAYAYSRTLSDTIHSDVFSSAAVSMAPWSD